MTAARLTQLPTLTSEEKERVLKALNEDRTDELCLFFLLKCCGIEPVPVSQKNACIKRLEVKLKGEEL